jgi:hypothetical protein
MARRRPLQWLAEYRGIFLEPVPHPFVGSGAGRGGRTNLFDRRIDGHPPFRDSRNVAHSSPLHNSLRFKRHRESPRTIAMITEIRPRAKCDNAFPFCAGARERSRATVRREQHSVGREKGTDRGRAESKTHERGRIARSTWRTDRGDNCDFLSRCSLGAVSVIRERHTLHTPAV